MQRANQATEADSIQPLVVYESPPPPQDVDGRTDGERQNDMNDPMSSDSSSHAASGSSGSAPRLHYLDNLKIVLTTLLVAQHAAHPYSTNGVPWPVISTEKTALLVPLVALQGPLLLTGFFFLAGFFLQRGLERHEGRELLRRRAIRLGIPLLFGTIAYALFELIWSKRPLGELVVGWLYGPRGLPMGHFWFLAHLLVLTVVVTSFREPLLRWSRRRSTILLGLSLGFAVYVPCSVAWRLAFPLREWTSVFGIPVELGHVPLYQGAFVVGIVVAAKRWLPRLAWRHGAWMLAIAAVASLPQVVLWPDELLSPRTWSGAGWAAFESLFVVGALLCLTSLFRTRLDRTSPLVTTLSQSAYATYIFHLPIVGGIQLALVEQAIAPGWKFLLTVIVAVPASFGASALLRRLPILRIVLD